MHAPRGQAPDPGGPEDVDALRRRLYAPDATPADVARYRTAAAPAPASAPSSASAPSAAPGRRPIRVAAAALVLALIVAVAALAGTAAAVRRPPATPGPSAAAGPHLGVERLRVPADARARFVARLGAGRSAGIAAWLLAHPDARPARIRTVGRADSQERRGDGPVEVTLDPSALAARGGRVTVVLVVERTAALRWSALSASPAGDLLVASRRELLEGGAATAATFRYGSRVPDRFAVDLPERVPWGVLVVYTD